MEYKLTNEVVKIGHKFIALSTGPENCKLYNEAVEHLNALYDIAEKMQANLDDRKYI